MKTLRYLLLPLLVFVAAGSAFAGSKSQKTISETSVSSLLIGVESENFGLQTSAAYLLGEIRASRGVIPLMRMLHSSDKEEARIMAALSLFKINSSKGLFAVKQAARFDESERVRKICLFLYFKSIGIEPLASNIEFTSKW